MLCGAVHMPAEKVCVLGSLSADLGPLRACEHGLGRGELFEGDEGLMGGIVGPDPIGPVVPSHLGLVAEGDVLDV